MLNETSFFCKIIVVLHRCTIAKLENIRDFPSGANCSHPISELQIPLNSQIIVKYAYKLLAQKIFKYFPGKNVMINTPVIIELMSILKQHLLFVLNINHLILLTEINLKMRNEKWPDRHCKIVQQCTMLQSVHKLSIFQLILNITICYLIYRT